MLKSFSFAWQLNTPVCLRMYQFYRTIRYRFLKLEILQLPVPYIQDTKFVVTMPGNVLVPNGTRPSAETSVRLSVCLSVTPFWLCSHHHIITKFSAGITNDKSDVHAKGQSQRSKVKVTEVTTQLNRFRTVTPVWIHIWWWNHPYGLMIFRRGALLFFDVIRQISRSHGSKKRRIWPRLGVSGL